MHNPIVKIYNVEVKDYINSYFSIKALCSLHLY